MKKVILSITVIFAFAALLPNTQPHLEVNTFYGYFLYAFQVITQNYFLFIIGFITLTVILFRSLRTENNRKNHKHYLVSAFQVLNEFIVGIFLSFVVLVLIAFIELNVLSLSIHMNKNLLGVVTDRNTIIYTLQKAGIPPHIIASDKGQNRELVAIASAISGTDNFYGNYILSSIPRFVVVPVNLDSSVIMIDDNLIITELNKNDLEAISPTLSYLLVQKYFFQRRIKSYPKISIMTEVEYQTYRKNSFKENLVTINQEVTKLQNQTTSIKQTLDSNKNKLQSLKTDLDTSTTTKESEYKACLADGKYTLLYCKNLLTKWSNIPLDANQIATLTTTIASDESNLKKYEDSYELYSSLAKSVKILTENTPHELGLFVPKNTIRIVFSTSNSHRIADYLETLVHEYIHYASFVSDNKKLADNFFEESLTEYFARQVIKDDLHVDTNVGYPIFSKIISQMTKRILESDLEDIYFTKDQARLEQTLDQVYGDGFYKDTRTLFLTLQYTSDAKQALQAANAIMKKMGGEPFKESDLFDSSSEL